MTETVIIRKRLLKQRLERPDPAAAWEQHHRDCRTVALQLTGCTGSG